jgi:hypothetical protein
MRRTNRAKSCGAVKQLRIPARVGDVHHGIEHERARATAHGLGQKPRLAQLARPQHGHGGEPRGDAAEAVCGKAEARYLDIKHSGCRSSRVRARAVVKRAALLYPAAATQESPWQSTVSSP